MKRIFTLFSSNILLLGSTKSTFVFLIISQFWILDPHRSLIKIHLRGQRIHMYGTLNISSASQHQIPIGMLGCVQTRSNSPSLSRISPTHATSKQCYRVHFGVFSGAVRGHGGLRWRSLLAFRAVHLDLSPHLDIFSGRRLRGQRSRTQRRKLRCVDSRWVFLHACVRVSVWRKFLHLGHPRLELFPKLSSFSSSQALPRKSPFRVLCKYPEVVTRLGSHLTKFFFVFTGVV